MNKGRNYRQVTSEFGANLRRERAGGTERDGRGGTGRAGTGWERLCTMGKFSQEVMR
jgi:hypothetical protein